MNEWSQANSSSGENVCLSSYTQFQSDYFRFLGKQRFQKEPREQEA